MINNGENAYLSVGVCEKSFGVEAAADYTLPDYQSDIRRILHVCQNVLPPAKYVSGDSVEFNGTIDYQVLYVGGDGGMYSAPLSGEYRFSVPIERSADIDITDGVSVLCRVCAEGVSTRVSAPRRLSIRSRLRPNVRIYAKLPVSVESRSEVDVTSVYTRTESCQSLCCESAVSDVIALNFSSPLSSPDTRVVSADARVCVTSAECTDNGVCCRGKVKIKLLCAVPTEDGEEQTSVVCGETPFEGEVDMDGCMSRADCRVRGILSEMSVSVEEGGVQCDVGIMLDAMMAQNTQAEYTADVYSTQRECTCETKDVSAVSLLSCGNANLTVSERIPLAGTNIPETAEIVDALASVCFDGCTLSDGKYVYTGTASAAVIYRNDGELYSTDVNIPVKYEAQTLAGDMPVCFDACADAVDVRARIEQENLCIDMELYISADCLGKTSLRAVSAAEFGDVLPSRETELTVCYPSPDDTLWTVAKRYKVAPAAVLGDPSSDRFVMIE